MYHILGGVEYSLIKSWKFSKYSQIIAEIIPESSESCRSHFKYYKYFQIKGCGTTKFPKEGVGVLQIFPKMGWGTDDLHKKG